MLTIAIEPKKLQTSNATPDLAAVENQSYRRLALEVIYQAVNDVKSSHFPEEREDALLFLSVDGPEWLSMAGYGIQRSHWDALLNKLDGIHAQRCREERITKFSKSFVRDLRMSFNQITYAAQPIGGF
jgi:hypothetical protein